MIIQEIVKSANYAKLPFVAMKERLDEMTDLENFRKEILGNIFDTL